MARGVAGLSPLGLWRFGQTTGTTANNEIVGGLSAALVNGAAFNASGLQGGGVRLDGVNDLVQVNHAGAYAPAAGAVSVWFNADALGRTQGIVSKNSVGLDAGGGFTVLMNADGTLTFTLESTTATFTAASTVAVTAGAWNHVAISWGAAGMQLWLNGVLVGSNGHTGGLAGADDPLIFGANTQNAADTTRTGATDFFAGRMDEASFFNRQLSASEIALIRANGVMGANTDPIANADAAAMLENGPATLTGSVTANDTDGELNPLSVYAVRGVAGNVGAAVAGTYGVLTLNADGGYSYALNATATNVQALRAGQAVTETFAYSVTDGNGGIANANLVITITGENDNPVVTAELRTITEDPTAATLTGNVLSNDRDLDGGALSVLQVNGVAGNVGVAINGAYGAMTIGANGAYSYTLANASAAVQSLKAGQVVDDVFTYQVSDGQGGVSTTTVTVRVTGRNDLPALVADANAVNAVSPAPVTGNVLTNDTDRDNDVLRVDQVRGAGANVGQSVAGTYGNLILNADGSYTYTLDMARAATIALRPGQTANDTFAHRVNDGNGGAVTSNLVITVTGANDGPRAVNDARTITEDPGTVTLTGNVLSNDSDPDGGVLVVTAVNGAGANLGVTQIGVYGALTLGANGAYSYVLNNASSAVQSLKAGQTVTDTFSYAIEDGQGGVATANIAVTVTGRNDAPTATPTAAAVSEDNVVTASGTVMPNARDVDGDILSVSAVRGVAGNVGAAVAGTYGSLTLNSDGTYTYALNNSAANVQALNAGQTVTDTFAFTLRDPSGGAVTTNLVISIAGAAENRLPLAAADAVSATEDTPVTFDPRSNDSDPDANPLTITQIAGQAIAAGGSVTLADGATVTLNANGALTYDPAANANGAKTFSYTISDGRGGTASANVTVSIAAVNDAPAAVDDTIAAFEDTPITFDVRANDSDVDNPTLSVTQIAGQSIAAGGSVTLADGATVTLNANGTLTYAPLANASGVRSFQYTVSDGALTSTATATINIAAVNDAPVVTNDAITGDADLLLGDVYRGDGLGGFSAAGSLAGGRNSFAIGDIDNDGDADVVNVGEGAGVTVNRNNGDGTFAVSSPLSGSFWNARLADLDGDGDLDAFVSGGASFGQNGFYNRVLLNDGAGNFTPTSQLIGDGAANQWGVALADYDRDGDVDAFVTGNRTTDSKLYLNNGDGTFNAGTVIAAQANDQEARALDFDGDGDSDIVVVANNDFSPGGPSGGGTGQVRILQNDGAGNFTLAAAFAGGATSAATPGSRGVAVGDLDNDGDTDFVVNSDSGVRAFLNNEGVFADSGSLQAINSASRIGLVDADLDGDLDIVATDNGPGRLLLNNGSGGFTLSPTSLDGFGAGVGVADLDRDGISEDRAITIRPLDNDRDPEGGLLTITAVTNSAMGAIVTINPDGRTVSYNPTSAAAIQALNAGEFGADTFTYTVQDAQGATRTATVTIRLAGANDAPVAANDAITGDADIIVTDESGGTQWTGDGLGGMAAKATGGVNLGVRSAAYGDMDSDGDLDLVSSFDFFADGLRVYRNDGAGNFTPGAVVVGGRYFDAEFGDLDGDGDLDVFAGGGYAFTQNGLYDRVLLNDGAGNFTATSQLLGDGTANHFAVLVRDFDGDGDLDAYAGGNRGTASYIYRNNGDGTFATPSVLDPSDMVSQAAAADIDGDGDLDLIVTFNDDFGSGGGVKAYLNNGTAGFTPGAVFAGGASSVSIANTRGVATGDIDNDGDQDFVISVNGGGRVFRNDGAGFTDTGQSLSITNATRVALADIDLDGDLDSILTDFDGATRVFANNGSGVFSDTGLRLGTYRTNDAAAADLDRDGISEDRAITVRPLDNDRDPEGGLLTITAVTNSAMGAIVTINPDGRTVSYNPTSAAAIQALNAGEFGADTFNYTVQDAQGASRTATVTIRLAGANEAGNSAPVAVDDTVAATEDTPVTFDVRANDTDADNNPLTVTQIAGQAIASGGTVTLADGATVLLNADGTLTYTPVANGNGAKTFTYAVSDGTVSTDATVTVNIAPVAAAAAIGFPITGLTPIDSADVRIPSGPVSGYENSIAVLADGGFVVTWTSFGQDGSGSGISARRYNAAGEPVGAEFRVNSITAGDQEYPSIAALSDGGFVVTWTFSLPNGSAAGVFAQRYDAAGMAVGGEFRVGSVPTSVQGLSEVAGLVGGGFVVTWLSRGQDGSGSSIYAQRYDSVGASVGAEFRVNTFTAYDQELPSIAALSDGGFVVTWQSLGQDDFSGTGIFAQRYDANGAAVGAEFQVNTFTPNFQRNPSVAALVDGGFVVAWQSNGQDGSGEGVYAQRYDASGTAVSQEFRVNSFTADEQSFPGIVALPDGGFVVNWNSLGQDGDSYGVYAQRYDAAGAMMGGEVRINAETAGPQLNFTVQTGQPFAVTPQGVLVATFFGGSDLNLRRFDTKLAFTGPEDTAISLPITLTPTEPGETISQIVLSGLPSGSVLSAGAPNADGSVWTLNPAQLAGLTFTPPANYNGAFTLSVTATAQDGADTEITTATKLITVTPVNDLVIGDGDPNTLASGPGADTLTGQGGADIFQFNTLHSGPDTITDFTPGSDKLEFSASAFGGGLTAGGAAPLTIGASPTATGTAGAFLYFTGTGALYWDPDGTGASAPILIVQLQGAPVLSASDIILG